MLKYPARNRLRSLQFLAHEKENVFLDCRFPKLAESVFADFFYRPGESRSADARFLPFYPSYSCVRLSEPFCGQTRKPPHCIISFHCWGNRKGKGGEQQKQIKKTLQKRKTPCLGEGGTKCVFCGTTVIHRTTRKINAGLLAGNDAWNHVHHGPVWMETQSNWTEFEQPFFFRDQIQKALARLGFYVSLFGVSPKGLNNNQKRFSALCNTHVLDAFWSDGVVRRFVENKTSLLLTLTAEKWIKGKRLRPAVSLKGQRNSKPLLECSDVWIVPNRLFSPLIAFIRAFVQWIVLQFCHVLATGDSQNAV